MSSTIQSDTPRLTLVSSAQRRLRPPSDAFDPIQFLQAMTASLELEEVIGTLTSFIHDSVEPAGWEYLRSETAEKLSGGRSDRHCLEYALTLNGAEMGTLRLMRGRRFSEDEQVAIESLLGLAAPAIQNALRFFDLSQQLERDPLTGLGNRRALETQGLRWLADSRRHHQPISMLVMDLDHFKSVNDTHGHPVGDRLLCKVAETLMDATRESDLCVRMGGDEFVVLLPWSGLEDALECAERIRRTLESRFVDSPSGDRVVASMSIGVASYRRGMDIDQLYKQADQALYAAKRAGGGRALAFSGTVTCERSDLVGKQS